VHHFAPLPLDVQHFNSIKKLVLAARCQFHQHFTRAFFIQKFVQSQTLGRGKTFERKICAFNVDEIDYREAKLA